MPRRLTIYGNWSSYDELSDNIPLTEELAMRQFSELLRCRANGVQIDAYLMDAFWFAEDGAYRTWRKPNWPDGPDRWLAACAKHDVIPGLWFTANTLCHLKPAPAWNDSADANDWGLCCFQGGFLADYLDVLDHWYQRGIRIFKIDFADFSAAPPSVKAELPADQIQARNIAAFRRGLARFRADHPEAIFMAFNGFELREYMDRTDRPQGSAVIDLGWLDVFDSVYSGDPRPADIPTVPFWRSVDMYGDYTARLLAAGGVPLGKIDNCGFMAGPTGTCYWRGKSMWKAMFILTLARGGDFNVLYGDLRLFSDEDAKWMAIVQQLFESAIDSGGVGAIGLGPGVGEPYGWLCGNELCVVVNPSSTPGRIELPVACRKVLFRDAGYVPSLDESGWALTLGPYQCAVVSRDGPDLGVQEDCVIEVGEPAAITLLEQTERKLRLEAQPGRLRVIARQRDLGGRLVRTFSGAKPASDALSIRAWQAGKELEIVSHHGRVVWSGMSWGAADIQAVAEGLVMIDIESTDPQVERIEFEVQRLVP